MNNIKDIRLPSVMRTIALPEPQPVAPKLITDPDYIDSVVPQTPFDLLDQTTGFDIAAEFETKRKSADEAVCRDVLVYLGYGLNQAAVIEIVWLRRGAEFGITKPKIETAVSTAIDLLAKQRKQRENSNES